MTNPAAFFRLVGLSIPILLFFPLLRPGLADPEGSFGFDITALRLPGIIIRAGSGDMNGDGEIDLLLFQKPSRESRDKSCSVFFQRDGKIARRPDVEIPLGENLSAVCVRDIDADGSDELCGFDGDGMTVFQLDGALSVESKRVLEHRTILPAVSRQIAPVDWLADLDSDGRIDALLPVPDGMLLFARKDDFDFAEDRKFEFPMNGSFRGEGDENYVSYRLPKIEFSDFDGDGHTDLGAFDLERMDFFLTRSSKTPDAHLTAPLLRKFTKDFVGASSFMDLNDDGVPDAVLVLMSQKKNLESEVQVYFGDEDFSYGSGPAQVYSGNASLIFPVFLDADGDGKMEMLLQDINVGIGFFLNYFLRNRIRVDTAVRKIASSGEYEERPSVRRAIYIQVSESGTEPARGAGDFNGDGLDDLAVGTAENRLSFFLSDRTNIIPREPNYNFDVPAYGNMAALNLNADGRDDLVILYTDEDKEDRATLFLSD